MKPSHSTLVALLAVLATAAPVAAQAVCGAPHSSPALAQGGSLETLRPGEGWVQLSGYILNADERFDWSGERRAFFGQGAADTRSAYLTAAVGVIDGVDVWGQAAFHRLRYSDEAGERGRTGVGDIRIAARFGAELFGLDAPVSLRAGVKFPGSEFPVDATVLPLSEGQTDAELAVETGRAFMGGTLYALGWVGHRWRLDRDKGARDPGNEWFAHFGVGGSYSSMRWELALEGLRGAPPVQQGIELRSDRRHLLQLNPSLARAVGPGDVDVGLQFPLAGRNLPSDPGISFGYRIGW